jgi:predicted ATPase
MVFAAACHCLRRESDALAERGATIAALAAEQGFPLQALEAAMYQALARIERGEDQVEPMRESLAGQLMIGSELAPPWYMAWLSRALVNRGQVKEAVATVTEALERIEKTGERWCEAELHRLMGELLLHRTAAASGPPEKWFKEALAISQAQSAKSWELRAATSLARLWRDQGKRIEARDLLAPIYQWFTEGFDTLDLKDARALLDELRS